MQPCLGKAFVLGHKLCLCGFVFNVLRAAATNEQDVGVVAW